MSALPSILCCFVIFQIVPQLLCDDTTIIPTDSSNKSTDISSSTMGVNASSTNIPLSSASPSLPPLSSSTEHPSDTTIKPTRAPTAAAAPGELAPASSLSTQPPLIHQHSAEQSPTANKTLKSSMAAEKNSTKTNKNSGNSIYNHGYLTSFVILLLVGANF